MLAAAHSRVGGQTDPALIGWQRLGGWWRAALPWKTDRIGNSPIATLGTEQRHCSHTVVDGKRGTRPSAAGVPPFERCRVGESGLPPL